MIGLAGARRIRSELLNRNIAILALAQAVAVTGGAALVTLGGIVGRDLAPTLALATLPVSMLTVGTALATVFAAWTMARIGRARGFACGAGVGCVGALCAIAGLLGGSFVLFCLAAALVGVANAFAQQYRFAAMESVGEKSAGMAVSITLAGSLVGAVLGPELVAQGEYWVAGERFSGTFLAVGCCYLIAVVLLLGLRSPSVSTMPSHTDDARSLREIARNRTFVVAVLGATVGFGVMAFVMTAAPLAMHVVDDHSLEHTAAVIQAHVLSMYAPSLVTGFLLARFGCRPIMSIGAALLVASLGAGLVGREVAHYSASMIALGVGWNFLFVGGTTLLGSAHRPGERFRVQAFNDFTVFSFSAAGSLGAGAVMQLYGWNTVLWASAPAIVLVLGVLVWGRGSRANAQVGHSTRRDDKA